jgi:hypothetical protein
MKIVQISELSFTAEKFRASIEDQIIFTMVDKAQL